MTGIRLEVKGGHEEGKFGDPTMRMRKRIESAETGSLTGALNRLAEVEKNLKSSAETDEDQSNGGDQSELTVELLIRSLRAMVEEEVKSRETS